MLLQGGDPCLELVGVVRSSDTGLAPDLFAQHVARAFLQSADLIGRTRAASVGRRQVGLERSAADRRAAAAGYAIGPARPRFHAEGLGCEIDKDTRHFVSFHLGEGSPQLALYEWDAAVKDAGVSPEGSGFRGASFHLNPDSRNAVDETMRKAVAAGTTAKSTINAAGPTVAMPRQTVFMSTRCRSAW